MNIRRLGIFALLFLCSACASGPMEPPGTSPPVPSNGLARNTVGEKLDLSGYMLTFDDEFDSLSAAPDGGHATWFGPIHTSFGEAPFVAPPDDDVFFVKNGVLTIRASAKDGKWKSGLLQSVDSQGRGFSQAYGYFEMRAKLPAGHATWPAFWLLTLNTLTEKAPTRGEIDVVETYGDQPGVRHSSVHVWPPKDKHWFLSDRSSAEGMTAGFHRYGVMITPEWVTFYYDGAQSFRFPTIDVYKAPVYVLIDLAMIQRTLSLAENPSDLLVDYVRVYAKRP